MKNNIMLFATNAVKDMIKLNGDTAKALIAPKVPHTLFMDAKNAVKSNSVKIVSSNKDLQFVQHVMSLFHSKQTEIGVGVKPMKPLAHLHQEIFSMMDTVHNVLRDVAHVKFCLKLDLLQFMTGLIPQCLPID